MKFMLFASTALAATAVKRQVSVVESALASISSGTASLRQGINGFSGIADAGPLADASTQLVATINQANSDVGAIAMLGNEAAGLATPLQDLASLVSGTVDDLIAKKQTFVDAGVAGIVLTQAQDLSTAANTFKTTTLGKVPSNLQDLGNQLASPITDALARAVAAFQDAGNGSGSSAPSGSATSAPSGSATSGPAYSTTSAPAGSTSAPAATTSKPAASATTSKVGTYTGAAIANAANGYGAVAMAVLAGAAML